jgi:hypothetical protein
LPPPEGELGRLSQFEAGEQHQIVGHHGGPDVGPEVFEPAPRAAGGAIGALEAGDRSLDAGAEIAQTTVDPKAFDHVSNGDAALLVEGDIRCKDRREAPFQLECFDI